MPGVTTGRDKTRDSRRDGLTDNTESGMDDEEFWEQVFLRSLVTVTPSGNLVEGASAAGEAATIADIALTRRRAAVAKHDRGPEPDTE